MVSAAVTFIHYDSWLWHTEFNNSCRMVKYFLKLDATFFLHESAELLSTNKLFLKL